MYIRAICIEVCIRCHFRKCINIPMEIFRSNSFWAIFVLVMLKMAVKPVAEKNEKKQNKTRTAINRQQSVQIISYMHPQWLANGTNGTQWVSCWTISNKVRVKNENKWEIFYLFRFYTCIRYFNVKHAMRSP